ncbi:MAG: prepilin-type N-terminal cleavage/methylation domain-containing protein [bacterium]
MNVLVNRSNNKSGLKKMSLKNAGFTLIELLVVLGIFALIMGIALFNQAGLNSNILLTNLAYETALAVREAQTYGIGVRAAASSTAIANFDKGYGAYFDTSTGQNQIVVFGDSNSNNSYDGPSELESLYQVQNQRGNKISLVCVGPSCTPVTKLAIMFKRPNPEASFWVDSGGSANSVDGPATIVVSNADNKNCRSIIVEVTGQIRVENTNGICPGASTVTPAP